MYCDTAAEDAWIGRGGGRRGEGERRGVEGRGVGGGIGE